MAQKALILGAGRVSAPCVEYLARKGVDVTIVDVSDENLSRVAELCPAAHSVRDDATDAGRLIGKYSPDVVISLLPHDLMFGSAKQCLEKKVGMVFPAYAGAEYSGIADEIKSSGLVFVAELGLDPGIDHMSASRAITSIHGRGGKVESFRSLCGALPALEANNNPWGYKLSWAPASLIGASKRTAKTIKDGQVVTWADGETYKHVFMLDIPGYSFEVYANADSTPYIEAYGIPECGSIYRGTLRYPGWCETICYMNKIRFFDTDEQDCEGLTFAQFTARQAGRAKTSCDAKAALCEKFGLEPWSAFILKMEWLGFFSDRPLPFSRGSARDVVAVLFDEKLTLGPDEKDLVVLIDEITASYPDGRKRVTKSVLIDEGVPGKWTSIARTTGVPPAIAARYILEGKIGTPGLHKPSVKEIYEPILKELTAENIKLEESEYEI
jgi:saccharopine dehydrogenase-like NADP-dependent oxidoreductase